MKCYPLSWRDKKLIVFDLDGTLAKSKQPISSSVALLLTKLLKQKRVAVISGGGFSRCKSQIINPLRRFAGEAELRNLFLFPTTAMALYRYRNGWKEVYQKKFSLSERKMIRAAFYTVLDKEKYHPRRRYGALVEDRGTEITFSAIGQRAPLGEKKKWNKNKDIRPKLLKALKKLLHGYDAHIAGLTSIDVTKRGIDKAFGIRQAKKYARVRREDVLFVGDAFYRGGNDAPALKTGVAHFAVKEPKETETLLRFLAT